MTTDASRAPAGPERGRSAPAPTAPAPRSRPTRGRQDGFVSLEWALTLPVLALVAGLLLAAGLLVRDVLVLQEAARVGARVASTTTGDQAVTWAVQDAAPELADGQLRVRISPALRQPGDQVQVEVSAERRYGPLSHRLRATSVARVEPIVDSGPVGPVDPLRPADPTAPRRRSGAGP